MNAKTKNFFWFMARRLLAAPYRDMTLMLPPPCSVSTFQGNARGRLSLERRVVSAGL
ncbi:MAG: hypothetical protein LBU18_07990 [Treponema sp.]|nr:hypothetical protein [Treponema sp.]